ncbi:glycosyltransferase [Cryobacterium psychrophilum]|uniref:Glycosyltransferase n=2 Tax=Cryobacterium psychrophilum TaxID=41988 RepID=A0A4Y8KJX4_9MICO|nr:glycosyltransferase [Cryobacterium psychrophilum]
MASAFAGPRRTGPQRIGTRARLYRTVRSAHLERAHELAPATIVYRTVRYDFEDSLADGLNLVQAGPVRAAWLLVRSPVRELEVTEPLMLSNVAATALAITGLRLRALVGGPRTRVVSYLIENANALAGQVAVREIPRRAVTAALARYIWKNLDRVVFGTDAARLTYESAWGVPRGLTRSTLIPALPAPCTCAGTDPPEERSEGVIFLGALAARKGVPELLLAWPLVVARLPAARLTIVGKGELESVVRQAAAADPTIEVVVDPSRENIHRLLRRSAVLTLPSQPTRTWREQVGLPIVEGLAHGCSVVTTSQTGLAAWLEQNGHAVVEANGAPQLLADAIIMTVLKGRPASSVTASLPDGDGRLAADAWLFEG